MNRETRERREKILFTDECYAVQGVVFDVYRVDLLVNFGTYPKAEIIRIANTNFRVFRAFRG
ncbi:MAG: hypothetical protein CVU60_00805 [Deltaproteobacteria bacterium HGW-Deltaproteobacteria-18]|jgi:hypothetical protein|nr:MAG: hypothetical protein CVU60_00805 [Deltaproteobacteria bacterium HGW-Deltaproteobacteria-18]